MTGFQHDIAGGAGALIIPSLHSPNYVPGVSGWAIFENGNVEFNSGTFRGTVTGGAFDGTDFIINSAGAFFYSGTPAAGNLIAAIAASPGTDSFNNPYDGGYTAYTGTPISFKNLSAAFGVDPNISAATASGGAVLILSSGAVGSRHTCVLSLLDSANANGPLGVIPNIAANQPGTSFTEGWHAVSLPSGMTGTIRVKYLAELNSARLDVNAVITSSLTTANTYVGGALPTPPAGFSYYPTGSRQFPLSVNGQFTATSNASPRVIIPVSPNTISFPMPGFAAAGSSVIVSGCVDYPLD